MDNKIKTCCAFPNCHKINATMWCGGCKTVKYCNSVCQGMHWKAHKTSCKELAKINAGSNMSRVKRDLLAGVDTVHQRLYNACYLGRLTDVDNLIAEGGDVNSMDNDGATCLYLACQGGHIRVADILLSHGAKINEVAKDGFSPLIVAAMIGNEPLVALLLENGAYINIANENGSTALGAASSNGHVGVTKLLLDSGANPFHRDNNGETPMDYAIAKNHPDIIALLETKMIPMV